MGSTHVASGGNGAIVYSDQAASFSAASTRLGSYLIYHPVDASHEFYRFWIIQFVNSQCICCIEYRILLELTLSCTKKHISYL